MALTPCRECKNKVSTEATVCPKCGVPNPTSIIKPKSKLKSLKANEEYARCEKNFCNERYKVIIIHKSSSGNKICESCGNNLESVSAEDANKDSNLRQTKISEEKIDIKKINEASKSKAKYFFNLINGLEGLQITFWGYFIGGNAFINVLSVLAQNEMGLQTFLVLVKVVWFIISGLGVFRAADIYKNNKIEKGKTYGYATAAKITIIVFSLVLIRSLI